VALFRRFRFYLPSVFLSCFLPYRPFRSLDIRGDAPATILFFFEFFASSCYLDPILFAGTVPSVYAAPFLACTAGRYVSATPSRFELPATRCFAHFPSLPLLSRPAFVSFVYVVEVGFAPSSTLFAVPDFSSPPCLSMRVDESLFFSFRNTIFKHVRHPYPVSPHPATLSFLSVFLLPPFFLRPSPTFHPPTSSPSPFHLPLPFHILFSSPHLSRLSSLPSRILLPFFILSTPPSSVFHSPPSFFLLYSPPSPFSFSQLYPPFFIFPPTPLSTLWEEGRHGSCWHGLCHFICSFGTRPPSSPLSLNRSFSFLGCCYVGMASALALSRDSSSLAILGDVSPSLSTENEPGPVLTRQCYFPVSFSLGFLFLAKRIFKG